MLKTTIRIKSFFMDEYTNKMLKNGWRPVKFCHVIYTICIFKKCIPDRFICKIAWLNKEDKDNYRICHDFMIKTAEKEDFYVIPLRKESAEKKDNLFYVVYPKDYLMETDLFSSYNKMILDNLPQNIFYTLTELLFYILTAIYFIYQAFCKFSIFNTLFVLIYIFSGISFIKMIFLRRKILKKAKRELSIKKQ